MPNWVANSVGCDSLEVLGKLRDFNRIIPMPLALEKTESGSNSGHYERLIFDGLSFSGHHPTEECPTQFPTVWARRLLRYLQHLPAHAACRVAAPGTPLSPLPQPLRLRDLVRLVRGQLGTKWNSHEYRLGSGDRCTFEMAWAHPVPLLKALSRQHPQLAFEVCYADEDLGINAGRYSIKNGKWFDAGWVLDGSREAYEIAFSLWGGEEDYRWDDERQTYISIDDDGEEDPDDTTGA